MGDRSFKLQVRGIAYAYIVLGSLGVTEALLELIVLGSISLDGFSVLAIFIGRGLLRWKEGSRHGALLFAGLGIFGAGVASLFLAIACYGLLVPNEVSKNLSVSSGWIPLILVIAFSIAWSMWQIKLLAGSFAYDFFSAERARLAEQLAKRKWQFSLREGLLLVTLVVFLLARAFSGDIRYETRAMTNSITDGGAIAGLEYGVKFDRYKVRPVDLAYIVFSRAIGSWSPCVKTGGGSSHFKRDTLYIETSDGTRIALPAEHQICEIIDGTLVWHDLRVTFDEFNEFQRPSHHHYKFAEFAEFVQQLRAKAETHD